MRHAEAYRRFVFDVLCSILRQGSVARVWLVQVDGRLMELICVLYKLARGYVAVRFRMRRLCARGQDGVV